MPRLGFDPRVTIRFDLDPNVLGTCGECADDNVPGEFRITHRTSPHGPAWITDVCGTWCADRALTQLLTTDRYRRPTSDIQLHLSSDWSPIELGSVA